MPVYSFVCACGETEDIFMTRYEPPGAPVCKCGAYMRRDWFGAPVVRNESPAWIRDTLAVVDPDECREAKALHDEQTRTSLNVWMRATGRRFRDKDEPHKPDQAAIKAKARQHTENIKKQLRQKATIRLGR